MALTKASSTVINTPSLLSGNFIQVAYNEITTSAVYSNAYIPADSSIPQITEGVEVLICTITPKYASSYLLVESNIFMGENINDSDGLGMALFRDSISNAIATSFFSYPGTAVIFGGGITFGPCYLKCKTPANATIPTTFRIRVGGLGGSANAVRINGANNNQYFGGSLVSYLSVYEVAI